MTDPARTGDARWSTVAAQECRDLWLGGRGPVLLVIVSILLSTVTYLAASNQILNFLEQREAVNLTLQVAVAVGALITLMVSADAISGERERGTLEALLLTPVSRRAIAVGKLAAALSLWLGALAVTVPYIWVLGRGVALVGPALLAGLAVGTLTALALSAVGLLISARSVSNKVSLSVSLLLLLALFAPTQLPTGPQGPFGEILPRLNPVDSALRYLTAVLVSGHHWAGELPLLAAPATVAVLGVAALTSYAQRLVGLLPGTNPR
jgi:ABC-2 type transport system permease protein